MPGILNVGNSYSSNNKKITSKLTFDVGEKFSGRVIKGDNNEVTIKLMDGWEFSAVIEGDILELQNVLQRFTVEGYENGKLRLKLIDKSSGDEEVSKDFTAIINKEGLKGNDKELLEAMIKFDIPLTKENIRDIKGLVQFSDKIKANSKEIEEFITKYLETKGIDVSSEIGEKLGSTLKEFFTSFKGLTKEDILLFVENGIDFNKENIDSYNNIFKGNSSINDLLEEFTKVSMLSLLKSMTGKSEDLINETLKNTENSGSIKSINEKEAILKNEISQSSNLDSLKSGNNLEDGTIKNASTKEVVQQIISKTGENNKEIIKDVLSALKSEGDISEKILTIIKNNINDIKVFNKFSEDYYYANLPISIKEREYPCKVIVKDNRKEGKKIDSKNVKMVITIDTKNLGVVDGYMKVNDRKIDVDLKCEEKSVKIVDMAKEKLIANIESMGFSVNVKVYKKLEEVSLTACRDFFNTGTKVSLDRRV